MMTYDSARGCAEDTLARVGKKIMLGLPLGLGKANHFANALYDLAAADPKIELTIFTALTLEVPDPKPGLETRFLAPLIERIYGGVTRLNYARDRRRGKLPPNITVREFFLQTGALLTNDYAQREYVSANYTHANRAVLEAGVNVIAQMVARRRGARGQRLSLSSNPDLALDLVPAMRARGHTSAVIGEINDLLPFMTNDAEVKDGWFDALIEAPPATLFSSPSSAVTLQDHAIGLHVSRLVKDGGTLQIGIGSLSDAVAHALLLRQERSETYTAALGALDAAFAGRAASRVEGGTAPIVHGLYGCSEMVSDGLLALFDAGLITRTVSDGAGRPARAIDGAFYLGSRKMYERLRAMNDAELALINMTSVGKVNGLYREEELRRAQRTDARFINTVMEASALGGAASDALADGRIVSGVGGQYNFVAMAHELDGARSILMLRATKPRDGRLHSNIVWQRPNETIPRHLRDVFVCEYGVADLRGQPDAEVVKRMLAICDSRFQAGVLAEAKRARKIEAGYEIPDQHRANTPERLAAALAPARAAGALPAYPFGSDLTETEQTLAAALQHLQRMSKGPGGVARLARSLTRREPPPAAAEPYLARLGLGAPKSIRERAMRRLVVAALRATGAIG